MQGEKSKPVERLGKMSRKDYWVMAWYYCALLTTF